MTEPSFGSVYNTDAIDINSTVNFSNCPTSPSYLEQTVLANNMGWFYQNKKPIVEFIDDYGEREFACASGSTLYVYNITTSGTPTITLQSSTSFSSALSAGFNFYWFGIKKESSSLYYIYYANSDDTQYGSGHYMKYGRIEVTPGGGSVNTVLHTYMLTPSYHLWVSDVKVVGRKGYVGWIRGYTVTNEGWHTDAYIFSLDMETDSCGGGLVHQSSGTITADSSGPPYNLGAMLKMAEANGSMKWCLIYNWNYWIPTAYSYRRIVLDGNTTDTAENGNIYSTLQSFQYNSDDYLFVCRFYNLVNHDVLVKIPNGVIGSAYTYTLEYYGNPLKFNSQSNFPRITNLSGFYWVNLSTGLPTTLVSISGVDTIYGIFPTLDSYNGNIYMWVSIGGAQKIISTDSVGGIINNIYDIAFPIASVPVGAFNHGNFFVIWNASDGTTDVVYTTYVISLTTTTNTNVCRMIVEQN